MLVNRLIVGNVICENGSVLKTNFTALPDAFIKNFFTPSFVKSDKNALK